ncbi:MAG: oxidoreductase [Pseudomonadota bacterium]
MLAGLPLQATADTQSPIDDPVLLTVTLTDDTQQEISVRRFTLEQLAALPSASFSTSTIWTEGPQTFEGVWMSVLLRDLDVTDGTVLLQAFNDYSITTQASDFVDGGALLAYRRNGVPMSTRDNGPLWLVWNYDADLAFRTETIYALSIWQLDRITISR